MVTMFLGQEPHKKPKDVGNKLFQTPTTETGCRKKLDVKKILLLSFIKPKTHDPKEHIVQIYN